MVIVLVTGVGDVGCVGVEVVVLPLQPITPVPMKTRATIPSCKAPAIAFLRRMESIPRNGRIARSGVLEERGRERAALRAVVLIESETVVVPLLWTLGVPNVQDEPDGKPEHAYESVWLNPATGVIVKVVVAVWPPVTESVEEAAEMVKEGCWTVTVTALDVEGPKTDEPA